MHIVGAQTSEKIALIAVHIAQRLETVLLAAVEKPVDRTLLIRFQVVSVEVIQEVAADHLAGRTFAAERVGNKLEVFFQRTIPFSVFTAFVEWIPFCRNPLRFFVTGAVPTEILEINFVPKT